jgi:hypothetical protein
VVGQPLGDELLIASELTGRVVVLDPVSAVLWSSFDGMLTGEDLVEDLVVAVGGDPERCRGFVDDLVEGLRSAGFLDGPLPAGVVPRRLHPPPDPDSCLGKRLGMERATIAQVGSGPDAFRFGTTDPLLMDEVRAAVDAHEPDERPRETFMARICPSGRRVRRTQQLFDSLGNVLFAGRDADRCAEALRRTVSARLDSERRGVWSEGPALLVGERVVLLHPAIGHEAVGPLRRELGDRGVGFAPSAFLELTGPTEVVLPADDIRSEQARVLQLAGVVVPEDPGDHSVERFVLAMARRLDDAHLAAFLGLARSGPIVEVPQGRPVMELIDTLVRAVRGPGSGEDRPDSGGPTG